MARWQYQRLAAPIQFTADVTTTIEWYQLPSQALPRRYPSALFSLSTFYVPQHEAHEGDQLDWLPHYPDRIDRLIVRAADQPFFTTGALQPAFPIPEVSWRGYQPDRIDRLTVRAADQSYFTTGSTHSSLPIPDLSWQGAWPDRIWRTTLPTGAAPFLSLDPYPRAPAALLTAWAFYPDRINRVTLHPAQMPFFEPGPLVPIPTVLTPIEDRILLGQNQSIETPAYPSIGGSSTWS